MYLASVLAIFGSPNSISIVSALHSLLACWAKAHLLCAYVLRLQQALIVRLVLRGELVAST